MGSSIDHVGRPSDLVDRVAHGRQLDRPRLSEIARLAGRQGGPISHEQLVAFGLGRRAIQYWLNRGRLHQLYRGVYALGHEAVTPRGRLIAALLACGPGAAISHQTCAWWRGFWKPEPDEIHVTVPGRSRKGQLGIRLHLVRTLDPRDMTTRAGGRATTPERTLLDLAETTTPQRLRLAIDEADRLGLWRPDKVEATLKRSRAAEDTSHSARSYVISMPSPCCAQNSRSPSVTSATSTACRARSPIPR